MESAKKNDWLISQSLERSLDIMSAINRLSVHAKLQLAGVSDTTPAEETDAARSALREFVGTLSDLIEQAEESRDQIAFGADPRLGTLARQFLADREPGGGAVAYRPDELKELKSLLEQGDAADQTTLIQELSHLRSVLEQHSQADAAVVFNEV